MKFYKKCMNKLNNNIKKLNKTIFDVKDFSRFLRAPE